MFDEKEDHLLLCACYSREHQIIFTEIDWGDETPPDFVMDIHLDDMGFWSRLFYGLRYIFGTKVSTRKNGAFAEFMFNKKTAIKLRDGLNHFIDRCEEHEERFRRYRKNKKLD